MDRKEKRRRKKWIQEATEEQLRSLVFELRQRYVQTNDPNVAEMGVFAFETYKGKFGLSKLNEKQSGFSMYVFYRMVDMGVMTNVKDLELSNFIANDVVKKFKIFWEELDELGGFRIFIFDDKNKIDKSKIKTPATIEASYNTYNGNQTVLFDWINLPEETIKKLEDHIKLKGFNWS